MQIPLFQCPLLEISDNSALNREVLNGVGVDGVGGILPFFLRFFFFLRFSLFFIAFSFSSLFSDSLRGNDCNLLQNWGVSLQPRLHRPHAKLPYLICPQNTSYQNLCRSSSHLPPLHLLVSGHYLAIQPGIAA